MVSSKINMLINSDFVNDLWPTGLSCDLRYLEVLGREFEPGERQTFLVIRSI